jgi:signal transduction histidine kinase
MNGRILVVDDEPDILIALARILSYYGHKVETAVDGEDALEKLADFPAEVIVTDLMMPKMTGSQLIRRVKAIDEDIEIIVLTGYASLDNAIDCLRNGGASDFLTKPLDHNDILTFCIQKALERKRYKEHNRQLAEQLQETRRLEAIATLSGGMAHQFNNCLAVAIGNLDLLESDMPVFTDGDKFVHEIRKSLDKMAELTKQLLAYARESHPWLRPIGAAHFFQRAVALLDYLIPSRIELHLELDAVTRRVYIDNAQMQMVLAALLKNAVEAIEGEGRIDIHLQMQPVAQPKNSRSDQQAGDEYICLSVRDNGAGMDELTLSRIFDPFFSTRFQGRGLGLAAVQGILESHGGWIDVVSAPGQGSLFTLFLPLPAAG